MQIKQDRMQSVHTSKRKSQYTRLLNFSSLQFFIVLFPPFDSDDARIFLKTEVGCFAKPAEINIPLLLMSEHSISVSTAHVVGAECFWCC